MFRIRFSVFALLVLFGLAACNSQSGTASSSKNNPTVGAVQSVLEAQQASWNRGDLQGFMDGYERAETTTFISGDEVTHGWPTVLDRYRQHYTSPEQMGTLTFSDLQVESLGDSYALADGRWQLKRANDSPHGRFTLLFRRNDGNWRIVHDTTTSATP